MKNIHLLPTDKISRVFITNEDKYGFREHCVPDTIQTCKNHNIHITSDDEEVKDGDWCYYENGDLKGVHKVVNGQRPKTILLKKIILTTDQDLINDGLQEIDNGFLEWFVKNPSCEYFEISTYHVKGDISGKLHYKIITPQEEEQLPTPWFKTEQIETWIGESITTEGKEIEEIKGGRGKLIVMHQCGENKEALISQLETMIYGLKEGFEYFAAH